MDDWAVKFLTLSAAIMLLVVAVIAFFNNQIIIGMLSIAASGASLATWFVYGKQAK